MQIKDSSARYGAVSRALHWVIAALILWQLASMVAKNLLGREDAIGGFMAGTHGSVGFVVFVLVWLRLGWVLINRRNRPAHGQGLLGLAAKLGHVALYGLMLFVPTVAVLRAFGSERPFSVFGIQIFAGQPPGQGIEALTGAAALHGEMAWLMAVLITGHIVMAVLHSAVMKDRTIARMAGRAA